MALDTLEKGTVVHLPGEEDAPVRAAEAARKQLGQRKADAEAMAVRTQGTRDKIAKLRGEVEAIEKAQGEAPSLEEFEKLESSIGAVDIERMELRRKLREADERWESLTAQSRDWLKRMDVYNKADDDAEAKENQASDLEATLDAAGIAVPSPEEFTAADEAITSATALTDRIRAARKAHDAIVDHHRCQFRSPDSGQERVPSISFLPKEERKGF